MRSLRLVSALAGLGLLLTACTSGPATSGTSSTTTVTTTTLPPPTTVAAVKVGGTAEPGLLGSVERVPVVPEAPGQSGVVLPAPGTPAYRQVVMIGYRQFGAGKPLVLIPGEGATMSWWSPQVLEALATHYRVTVFDLPGTGYSGPPRESLGLDYLADLTSGFLSELGLAAANLVGWGLGAQVGVALAERHRGVLSSLVLLNSGLPLRGSVPPTRAGALLGNPNESTAALAAVLFPAPARTARLRWISAIESQVPDDITAPLLAAESHLEAALWRSPFRLRRGALRGLPLLVVDATDDAVFPPGDAEALAAALPGAQRYVWRGGGYGCFAEDPKRFLAVLSSFTG